MLVPHGRCGVALQLAHARSQAANVGLTSASRIRVSSSMVCCDRACLCLMIVWCVGLYIVKGGCSWGRGVSFTLPIKIHPSWIFIICLACLNRTPMKRPATGYPIYPPRRHDPPSPILPKGRRVAAIPPRCRHGQTTPQRCATAPTSATLPQRPLPCLPWPLRRCSISQGSTEPLHPAKMQRSFASESLP